MIAVVRPQMLEAVEAVLDRWELEHAVIGEVTATGQLRAFWQDDVVSDPRLSADGGVPALRGGAGAPSSVSPTRDRRRAAGTRGPRRAPRLARAAKPRVRLPSLRPARRLAHSAPSRFRRCGCCGCARRCAVSRSRSTDRGGSPASIRTRAARSPCSKPRATSRTGGEPLGFTDRLNFGNPEKPEIGWELAHAIDGIAAACEAFGAPVVSGNVSLYNEMNGRAIHPTPVVGAVGLVEDVERVPKVARR